MLQVLRSLCIKNRLFAKSLIVFLGTTSSVIGMNIESVTASTMTFPFDTVYDVEEILTPIPETDLFDALVTGFNPDAPYGLTDYIVESYVLVDIDTGIVTFDTDPTQFGLEGFPTGSVVYSGSGEDRLIGISSGTATLDFTTGLISGLSIETIVDGTGRFDGATGVFEIFESEPIPDDPTATVLEGQAQVSGSFQTTQSVPEPQTNRIWIGIGLILISKTFLRRTNIFQR